MRAGFASRARSCTLGSLRRLSHAQSATSAQRGKRSWNGNSLRGAQQYERLWYRSLRKRRDVTKFHRRENSHAVRVAPTFACTRVC